MTFQIVYCGIIVLNVSYEQDHNSQPRIKRPPLPGDHLTSEATLLFTMFGLSICFTRRTKTTFRQRPL